MFYVIRQSKPLGLVTRTYNQGSQVIHHLGWKKGACQNSKFKSRVHASVKLKHCFDFIFKHLQLNDDEEEDHDNDDDEDDDYDDEKEEEDDDDGDDDDDEQLW